LKLLEAAQAFWIPVFRKNEKPVLNRTSLILTAEYISEQNRKNDVMQTRPLSLSGFESFHSTKQGERVIEGVDREIEAVRHKTIRDRQQQTRNHRITSSSGGLQVGVFGKVENQCGWEKPTDPILYEQSSKDDVFLIP
jgi:hypothetical protein